VLKYCPIVDIVRCIRLSWKDGFNAGKKVTMNWVFKDEVLPSAFHEELEVVV
jgi:hypothetical protein